MSKEILQQSMIPKRKKIIHKDIELQTMNHDDDQQKEVKPFDAPPLPLVTIETVINDKLVASETEIKEEKEDWTTGYTIQRHISLVRPSKEWHRPDLTILTDEKQSGNQTSPTPTILTNTKEEICLNITAEESLHGCVPEKLDMPPVQGVETLNISKIDVQTAPRESLEKGSTIQEEPKDETAKIEKMKGFKGFIFRLWNLFVDSIGWHEKKWYEKVLFIVVQWLPNLIMNFTIPKVDDAEWNRLYIICIPMFAPIVFLYALGSQYLTYLIQGVFPLAVVVFFAGALVSALFLILLWKYPDKPPKLLVPILVIFAFILCVVWLYIVANEVQNILQATGEAWGIGDAILGVTILAWGNSIGDFVANVAVTRKGFGSMGVGACYGGPMLNLLVGLGIGFTFNPTQLHNFCYPLTGDPVVSFSFIFLIMLLLMSLTVIPLCKFRVRRPYGVILIITYLIYMVFAILASVVPVVQNAFTWTIGRGC
jgi:Ca2+/Na+ antiporter